MKLKDLLELCMDKFCGIEVYDYSTQKTDYFSNPKDAISKCGNSTLSAWEVRKHRTLNVGVNFDQK